MTLTGQGQISAKPLIIKKARVDRVGFSLLWGNSLSCYERAPTRRRRKTSTRHAEAGTLQRFEEYVVLVVGDLADNDAIDNRGIDMFRSRLGHLTGAGCQHRTERGGGLQKPATIEP